MMDEIKASFISNQVTAGEYYYLNMTPKRDSCETVVCGGREQCSPDYRIERQTFKFHAIEFVAAGTGTLTMGGCTYELKPGMLFHYGPRTPHTIETDSEFPLLKHFVDFTGNDLTGLLRNTILGRGLPVFTSRPFRIRNLFENLIATGNTQSRNREILCTLLLRLLIVMVDDTATDTTSASSLAWQTYLRCRQNIERNFLEMKSVQDAARQCNIDKAYLARLFKRFAEEPPGQLLCRLKMNKAAELLGNRRMMVKEVSEAVGFLDPYHFSRVFKRVYGIPPETFTKTARRAG